MEYSNEPEDQEEVTSDEISISMPGEEASDKDTLINETTVHERRIIIKPIG